jgi:hypothetical protein
MAIYKNRKSIQFDTPNALTTHTEYLVILIDHYLETGNDILYKAAVDLLSFIESIPVRKK